MQNLIFNQKKAKSFFVEGLWIYGAKWDPLRATICDLKPTD